MANGSATNLLRYFHLLLFAALALLGVFVLAGWWMGQITWVQPRPFDFPIPANVGLCFLLFGVTPFIIEFWQRRIAVAVGLVGTILAGAISAEFVLQAQFGLDDLLTNHRTLIDGANVGKMPLVLSVLFLLSGSALVWLAADRLQPRRPLILALVGSISGAYGLAAMLATRVGLERVIFWRDYAHIGFLGAIGLTVFGFALVLLAARDAETESTKGGPRWLWLPVVVAGTTVTLLFWVSLREREVAYLNSTTQLNINNVAAVFSGETEAQINNLRRMADRWTDSGGTPLASWEKEARAQSLDFPAYRSISWVDANFRTRWLWPREGNEFAAALDHSRHPARMRAIMQAQETLFAIAAPLVSPVQRPSFVVYATVLSDGTFDGFIAGELSFQHVLEIIDARLNISSRYFFQARIANPEGTTADERDLLVFTSAQKEQSTDDRLRQSAVFNLMGQRITLELTPRMASVAVNRQLLPEVALIAGLGVALLLGLVFNLAQAARSRQLAAEETTTQLRGENEERRRVEERLKVADERLHLALAATQIGVLEWNLADGRAIYSAGFWNSLEYDTTAMEPSYESLLNLIHPADQAGYRESLQQHLAGKTDLVEAEFRVKARDGTWHWFAMRAKCVGTDRIGRPRRMAGTCQNVTSRKRAEEELRTSQAETRKLSLVASRTDNSVVITRADGRIEWVNDSFTRLAGHTLSEVAGRPFVELLASTESDPKSLERVAAAFTSHDAITTDVMHLTRCGRSYHVHLEIQPVTNHDEVVENFIVMETDITSRVEVEQQLRRAKQEADAASRAKSEFLASMSHEIRTPMNGVIGMTSLLNETPLTPEQRDYVQTIRTSGDALLSIINEILDFSKIESGHMELEHHPFELSQCIEETLDIFNLSAAAKEIEFAYSIEPDVPSWIVGDITRLRQILVNLVNNAVKFTPSGFITIETKRVAPADENGKVRLEFLVTDTGIGIPEDRHGVLFKTFSQVDSSTTRKYGGTGLGLAICDRLSQLMGGSIRMTSTLEKGSCFRFTILAEPATPPGGSKPLRFTDTAVLVVDDHPVNRRALEIALQQWGCQPLLASNSMSALEIFRAKQPLLAIIDYKIGSESGEALIEQLRHLHAQLPVILLTAASESVGRGNRAETTFMRLPKPVQPAFLGDCINRLLKGIQPRAKAQPASLSSSPIGDSIPLDILLVEDNPVNQKVALHLLDRLGYRADAVANGVEAVHAAQQRDYDLIFMDLQMPEMDGLTATQEIRRLIPRQQQPRIIALTANAVQGDRERCITAGMDDYVTKPVKLEQLHAVIEKYFRT